MDGSWSAARACPKALVREFIPAVRGTDGSGLVPHSPEWLEFWQRELDKSAAGQKYVRLTLEAARAICQATPDEDAGDVGGVGVQNNWAEQVP